MPIFVMAAQAATQASTKIDFDGHVGPGLRQPSEWEHEVGHPFPLAPARSASGWDAAARVHTTSRRKPLRAGGVPVTPASSRHA